MAQEQGTARRAAGGVPDHVCRAGDGRGVYFSRREKEGNMKDGYKVIDMDTHVNPSMEVLEK
jgi:hypothetical protein